MPLLARVHFVITAPLIILGLVSLALFVVVIIDMVRRPTWQWKQAGSNKTMWIVLEILSFVLFGFLSIVAGIIYLAAARPKLVAAERAGDMSSGHGGSWPGGSSPGGSRPGGPSPGGSWPGSSSPGGTWSGGYYSGSSGEYGAPQYPGAAAPPAIPEAPEPPPPEQAPPSWQPDPSGRHELRYWDGSTWTEHVADQGRQSTDPVGHPGA